MSAKITIGDLFGFWEVKEFDGSSYLLCLCTGCQITERRIRKWTLLRGESKSCGCQIKELMKQTNQEKYGVDFAQQNTDIKQKSEETLQEKYGETNAMKNQEVKKKSQQTKRINRIKKRGGYVFGVATYNDKS